jgi:hypothetical protein
MQKFEKRPLLIKHFAFSALFHQTFFILASFEALKALQTVDSKGKKMFSLFLA